MIVAFSVELFVFSAGERFAFGWKDKRVFG
jgi:hypothetical protein